MFFLCVHRTGVQAATMYFSLYYLLVCETEAQAEMACELRHWYACTTQTPRNTAEKRVTSYEF